MYSISSTNLVWIMMLFRLFLLLQTWQLLLMGNFTFDVISGICFWGIIILSTTTSRRHHLHHHCHHSYHYRSTLASSKRALRGAPSKDLSEPIFEMVNKKMAINGKRKTFDIICIGNKSDGHDGSEMSPPTFEIQKREGFLPPRLSNAV